VVLACDRRHFLPSDLPLVAAYARAIVADEDAAKMLREQGQVVKGKPNPWLVVKEKAHKEMISLSLRLRLSPQGRTQNPPKPAEQLSYYERMRMERKDEEA
jgi:phage terminase small subunit